MARLRVSVLALLLVTGGVAPAAAVDLVGTWYVLIHYRDTRTEHPERERWEDRIWVFEREESRLRWTDYPIVVFEDQSGRFEQLGTNRASRVLHFWEPNAVQLEQIRTGLEINSRGSTSKALRGSDTEGWKSGDKSSYQSARFITFSEFWQIRDVSERPAFIRDAVLGSATVESMEGRTLWKTESVDPSGDVLHGLYDRDGSRIGTFRMTRCGAVSTVKGSGKSQGQRIYEMFFGEMGAQFFAGEMPGGASEQELRAAIEEGTFSEEDREDLRLAFAQQIAESYRNQGNDPREFEPQIQSLAEQMVTLFVEEGKTMEEIQQMLQDGRLRP